MLDMCDVLTGQQIYVEGIAISILNIVFVNYVEW